MNEKLSDVTWPDFAIGLYDALTGRGAEMTYEFENLQVYVPVKSGPQPEYAEWKFNGIVKIRARDLEKG
jgi:hypothetical protein